MRIGILGGMFDPPHAGHAAIADAALNELELNGILLLPSGQPPHKHPLASPDDRLNMARLLAEEHQYQVSDVECAGKGPVYTINTLRRLHELHPEAEWVFLLGADALSKLPQWKRIDEVAALTDFAVIPRAGILEEELDAQISHLTARLGTPIDRLRAAAPDISSTEVRRRVNCGASIHGLVPNAVEAYILDHGLYLAGMPESELLKKLSGQITEKRFQHTLGVAETAARLAPNAGVSPAKARLAALLHDCAKSESLKGMKKLIERAGIQVDKVELENENVLHAPAGAARAQLEYGVNDPEILSAIRHHTLGGKDLTALEALIYIADCIEPNRKPWNGLEELRALAEEDIFAAARQCAKQSVDYVLKRGQKVHPRTLDMLNETVSQEDAP